MMDDSLAINAILQGDKNRYGELVTRYQRMVYAIAWSRLGDVDLSEDAAQETFVKAYSNHQVSSLATARGVQRRVLAVAAVRPVEPTSSQVGSAAPSSELGRR